jgi:RNA polymerase sigma-70 factor (ECF subfamily)
VIHRAKEPIPAMTADSELIAAVANGDLDALGRLYHRYEPAIGRYFDRLGVSLGDRDDLLQETFLEVARAAPRFDTKLSARSWIFGIATMMSRRYRRSLSRAVQRLAAWKSAWVTSPPPTPGELVERDQMMVRFEQAFLRLSSKKQETFVLVTLEGLSGEEVARALGVPVNTVWTRLHKARLELRAALEEVR